MLRTALRIAAVSVAALSFAVGGAWAAGGDAVPSIAPTAARVALVIGNSFYKAVNPLANPANDAQAMGQMLNRAGFEVITALNMNSAEMHRLTRDFAARVAAKGPDTVALVFYAGHGLQVDGENFLVPVDARLEREADVASQTMPLADVMKALENVNSRMRIVILDACRNNPFAALETGRPHGLALVDAPNDTILAYSTAPGTEAADGAGEHSPYAAALIDSINQPGVPIEQLFKQVRLHVHQQTQGKQTPWESSSLTSNFAFFSTFATALAAPIKVASNDPQDGIRPAPLVRLEDLKNRPAEQAYWYVISEDSEEYYQEFIRLYPDNPLCDQVRRLFGRRKQMVDWRDTVLRNTPEAYETYLSRHPHTDHEAAALRLRVAPRERPLDPIFAPRLNNGGRRLVGIDPRPTSTSLSTKGGVQLTNLNTNRQQLFNAENERRTAERQQAERLQSQRLNAERLRLEQSNAEKLNAARLQAERQNASRLQVERQNAARLQAERNTERLNAQRLAAERLNAQRLSTQRFNTERLRTERVNVQRFTAPRQDFRPSNFASNRFQGSNAPRVSGGFSNGGRSGGSSFGRR
jgi:uncharacterized caspase-like protein